MAMSRSGSSWSAFTRNALRVKVVPAVAERAVVRASGAGLQRRLGLWDLILMGIGASVGAGIFVVTGTVAQDAGPAVVLSFLLAGAACVLNALCYAELSNRFPALVGGAYLYTYSTFNELTAFLVFANLMFDYHIGAASIIRSLAGYLVTLLQSVPAFPAIPVIFGPGGLEFLGGWLSINLLAPTLLALLTLVLCQGVRESSIVNDVMTITKIVIVLVVILVGAFQVDVSNWSPFVPNGISAVIQGATVVYFAYVGFDAVANSAEESENPQKDLPLAIILSLLACGVLYVGVSLVVTGMVPYYELDGAAPLAAAFLSKGITSISILISVGAVAGLTTTVLVGLYVQSRLYLGLGRDGLLPSIFAKVHPEHHTPVSAQIWVGVVAGFLALLFDVSHLSHILSVGCLTGYSVVCACVVVLRVSPEDHLASQGLPADTRIPRAAWVSIIGTSILGFGMGLSYRLSAHPAFTVFLIVLEVGVVTPMYTGQEYFKPAGFACPAFPTVPLLGILLNIFLFAQLHYEAWIRFGVVTGVAVLLYATYGQHHSNSETLVEKGSLSYQKAPTVDVDSPGGLETAGF